jgi:hypothetical protein
LISPPTITTRSGVSDVGTSESVSVSWLTRYPEARNDSAIWQVRGFSCPMMSALQPKSVGGTGELWPDNSAPALSKVSASLPTATSSTSASPGPGGGTFLSQRSVSRDTSLTSGNP